MTPPSTPRPVLRRASYLIDRPDGLGPIRVDLVIGRRGQVKRLERAEADGPAWLALTFGPVRAAARVRA